MLKDMAFCHLPEHLVINMEKKLMDTATETGVDYAKTVPKRIFRKTAEGTGDLIGNKIADKEGKSKEDDKTKKVVKYYIPPEKKAANN